MLLSDAGIVIAISHSEHIKSEYHEQVSRPQAVPVFPVYIGFTAVVSVIVDITGYDDVSGIQSIYGSRVIIDQYSCRRFIHTITINFEPRFFYANDGVEATQELADACYARSCNRDHRHVFVHVFSTNHEH